MNIHTPTPSLLPHVCTCGMRDSDPTWHRQAVATVSPRREEPDEDAVQPPAGLRGDAVGVATGSPGLVVPVLTASPVRAIPTTVGSVPTDVARAVARRTDPSTSWEAARSVTGIRESQQEVLFMFQQFGPMTDERAYDEYIQAHGREYAQSISGFRTRRSELVARGLLRDTGERRRGSTGRRMIVWAAA